MTTAKLIASAPVLFVRDVHAAAADYRDAMGFSFGKIWGEPPWFVILHRDGMHVMVKQIDDHSHIVPRSTVSAGLSGAARRSITGCATSRTAAASSARRIWMVTISGSGRC